MPTLLRIASPSFHRLVCLLALGLAACSQTVQKPAEFSSNLPRLSADGTQDNSKSLTSKSPQDLVANGFAYLAADNPTLARLHFVTALQKDQELTEAYIGLGKIEYQTGNFEAALQYYERASSIQPDQPEALIGQTQVLRQMNKFDSALERISRAKQLAPDDYRVINEQAITYDLSGQEQLAAPLYEELIRKAPDQATAFNNLGLNHLAQQRIPEAVVAFHRAFELDGGNARVKNNLAMAFALQGSEEQALRLFAATVGEAAAWNNLGYLYMTQARYDDAERALRKALDLNPKYYLRAQENLDRLNQLRQPQP